MKPTLFSFFLFLLMPLWLTAQLRGKVVGVHDGDTFTLLTGANTEVRVRLHGIDCPELKQDFGQAAKKFTSEMIFGKNVTVNTFNKDRYGRTIGIVITPDGKNLNEEILRSGMGWHYLKYDQNKNWTRLESAARLKKAGLWKQPGAIPPWEYRKMKKK